MPAALTEQKDVPYDTEFPSAVFSRSGPQIAGEVLTSPRPCQRLQTKLAVCAWLASLTLRARLSLEMTCLTSVAAPRF